MSELPELTPRQAEAAVERAGESLALTSGAGCGKTLVLARRFTTLLMESAARERAATSTVIQPPPSGGGYSPSPPGEPPPSGGGYSASPFDRFVALTFTDKAAMEMTARVRRVLMEALRQSTAPADRRRLAEWITELPAAHISTIHGFCASMLRRHAIEAGVDPGFAVCPDELLVGQMLAEAAEDAVLRDVEANDPRATALLARTELGRVVEDVRDLLGRRIAWSAEEYADPERTLTRWREVQSKRRTAELARLAADRTLRGELDYLRSARCSAAGDKLDGYRRERLPIIERLLGGGAGVPPAAKQAPAAPASEGCVTAEELALLGQSPGNFGSASAWGGKEAMMDFRARLRELAARFAELAPLWAEPNEADRESANMLAALTGLAQAANERYRAEKRRAGLLDFDDLIDLTARLLRENPTVREGLRTTLGQLLVDEAQDTDAVQLTMLWNMLAEGDRPPPGKLFIVGDLKQSIYRFRGAQAEVFDDLCRRFGPGNRIPLDESFRTHSAGVAFVNHLFAKLMDGYEPVKSSRQECPPAPSVEILLAELDEEATAADAAEAQAQLTAERIAELISGERRVWDRAAKDWRAVRPGDVAILLGRMTRSLDYERALQQRDIPYYVVAGTGFFQQQEVFDVLNALRAIDNPRDDVALAGVLRSAMFGLDDNALLHVALAAGPPYFEKLASPAVLERLSPDRREKLIFAAGLLARLHRGKDALGPAEVIETLLRETGYQAVLLGQFQGKRKLGNVLRLLEAARASQASGGLALADFVARYGEFIIAGSRYEQAAVAGEGENVVRIMTIHKAKGLEFPVVVLPDLNAGEGPSRARMLLRPDWGLTCKGPGLADAEDEEVEPVSHALARLAEKADLAAEDIRKLYVAVTRHEDHLVLVGADWRTKDGRLREKGSFLDRIDGAMGLSAVIDAGSTASASPPSGGGEIRYGDGKFVATVARRRATPDARPGIAPAGRRGLVGPRLADKARTSEDLAQGLRAAGKPLDLPLVGPLIGAAAPPVRIAATALSDFAFCPKLFHWRYELRVPTAIMSGGMATPPFAWPCEQPTSPRTSKQRLSVPPNLAGGMATPLDPATAGTLYHRCMELLDFDAADLPAQAGPLVSRVLGEMELTVDPLPLVETFADMLAALAGGADLLADIRAASERLRELDFVMSAPGIEVAGQIDLLYRSAGGSWRIVDYKSDRVGGEGVAPHARRYELQMLLYLAAAARHLGETVADATLCFLRTAQTHRFVPSPGEAEARLNAVAERLRHGRRTGDYPRRAGADAALCSDCPYAALCLR